MSLGTRCQELAEYIVISSPLVMLADSPDEYRKCPDILKFLSDVPSSWDDTRILDAKYGEFALVAKRKGTDWYVGGMTNWKGRDVELDYSFLPKGKNFRATILRDAADADENAGHYKSEVFSVNSSTKQLIKMVNGGGFVLKITHQ